MWGWWSGQISARGVATHCHLGVDMIPCSAYFLLIILSLQNKQLWTIKPHSLVTESFFVMISTLKHLNVWQVVFTVKTEELFKYLLAGKQFRVTWRGFQQARWTWSVQKEPCLHKQQSFCIIDKAAMTLCVFRWRFTHSKSQILLLIYHYVIFACNTFTAVHLYLISTYAFSTHLQTATSVVLTYFCLKIDVWLKSTVRISQNSQIFNELHSELYIILLLYYTTSTLYCNEKFIRKWADNWDCPTVSVIWANPQKPNRDKCNN